MSFDGSNSSKVPASTLAKTVQRPRALTQIGYNSLNGVDTATSSEDEAPETRNIPAEDARAAIGVSIGREQTRLSSPITPAVEKAAVIERAGGFFGGSTDALKEVTEDTDDTDDADVVETGLPTKAGAEEHIEKGQTTPTDQVRPSTPERSPRQTDVRLPSPWRAVPRKFQRTDATKSALRDGLLFSSRKRASSGPDSTLESWQKAFMSGWSSMPKNFSGYSPFSSSTRIEDVAPDTKDVSPDTGAGADETKATVRDLPSRPQLERLRSQASQLRRSASDDSLGTYRTLSRVSSLGDDTRFEHVQAQVNSRLKAIKDSWQDSSIKLPTLPSMPSMANLRERGMSASRKPSTWGEASPQNEKPVDPFTRQPYESVKTAFSDAADKSEVSHPHFNRAISQLEGDLVVLGGYRGSILRSAKPPHRQLWVPIKVGLNLRKANLEVGIEEGSDERASETVIPSGMLTHIGPVDISRRLFKRLRHCENARNGRFRVHDYGYDWRLHPHYLSKQLISFLEKLACNQPDVPKHKRGATVIAHSLGGLITRHAVNQRPDLFKGVVYAGVPNTCVNILGPMRNGDDVLLSSRVLTAQVNFTIRTSFVLLPLDGRCFFDKYTREEYPVDFFDPATWLENRLSPCVARPLPPLKPRPENTGITGYMTSMVNSLPSLPLPGRKNSNPRSSSPANPARVTKAGGVGEPDMLNGNMAGSETTVANNNIDSKYTDSDTNASVSTTVTISREDAMEYLTRTLASVKRFKQELAFEPTHAARNAYPPISVIYGKTTPTVYGAKVDGREGIKHADAYDELAFASGDGVVLARAAMAPDGYTAAREGIVSSERGHVTLLGDLEAVGKCLNAVMAARNRGVGVGE